jgi:hypothetical protein
VSQLPQSGKNATTLSLIGLTVPGVSAKLAQFTGLYGRLADFAVTGDRKLLGEIR